MKNKLEKIFTTLAICSGLVFLAGAGLDRDNFIQNKEKTIGQEMMYGGGAGILMSMTSGLYVRGRNNKKEEESDTDYEK